MFYHCSPEFQDQCRKTSGGCGDEVSDIKKHEQIRRHCSEVEASARMRVFAVDVSPDSTRFVTGG